MAMSIKTEITRLQNAKTSIKTAIEGKGVTVPDGTKLDGMAALVDSISSGGFPNGSKWDKVSATGKSSNTKYMSYAKGAKVVHNGAKWISTVDNNVWEPGVYGWEKAV